MNEAIFVKQLISKKHREKAFSKLLDLYQERLYWHIRKIVGTHENADDVLQNTFIRVFKSIETFKQESSLHTWMYRIAYNESIRFIEKENRKKTLSMQSFDSQFLINLKGDEYFDGKAAQIRLNEVLELLSEKQKRVFQLKYYDNLKFREVAELLQMSENTIKTHYYSAVRHIEKNITVVSYIEKIKA
ncbi:RNA polymerase sigma factor [Tenacibaculum sp. C7A-26P2]|uniref:RNA polymerase sigma factor n=1 Tax=Tenacibaculum sp. C7A-26P2 TaxID=3447504 RepID=UPI003F862DF6